jgi:hypothetical protein
MIRRRLVATGSACILVTALSTPIMAAETRRASGRVNITLTQVALIGSAGAGDATLQFGGRTYNFRIRGLGIGGVGVSRLRASGAVYGLNRVGDFAGTYLQLRAGAVAGDAQLKGGLILRNAAGVELNLKPQREGIALNLGADGLLFEPR